MSFLSTTHINLLNKHKSILDSAEPAVTEAQAQSAAADFANHTIKSQSVAAVQMWAETDDFDKNEGSSDRLFALCVGIADTNKDGELDDVEQEIVEQAVNHCWNYLESKGVDSADLTEMFGDDGDLANEAGDRVLEFVKGVLPNGDNENMDDLDAFVFGTEATQAVLDSTFKNKVVVRNGQKTIKRVRVAGHVKLSAKQKIAIMKMQRKSHGALATAKRLKSNKLRKRLGLK